jgi:predicted thioesterase
MARLQLGLAAELIHTARPEDGADHWSNDLPVLATPVLLWLAELAAMRALTAYLDDDEMTVGTAHDASHRAPTPTGATIRVAARLTAIEGRQLRFAVLAEDAEEVVYQGSHERALVSASRFRARVAAKRDRLLGPGAAVQRVPTMGTVTELGETNAVNSRS